jgi:DNA-3-methyladenine glycosylase II
MIFTDPILQQLIQKYPPPTFVDRSNFLFEDLLETIISQQLSIKAANTIFERFKNLFEKNTFPTPKQILHMDVDKLRSAGISYQKIGYIKNIAEAFEKNEIKIEKILTMPDEEIILHLTKLKGVGKWTAEMILIFTLQRPDVFSFGDLGIRNAIKKLYNITDQKEIIKLSETWKPYRSSACWYLWRSLENG